MAVGQGVADDLSPYVLSCGLAGVLAYLGFDCAAARRREHDHFHGALGLPCCLRIHARGEQHERAGKGSNGKLNAGYDSHGGSPVRESPLC